MTMPMKTLVEEERVTAACTKREKGSRLHITRDLVVIFKFQIWVLLVFVDQQQQKGRLSFGYQRIAYFDLRESYGLVH